MTPAQERAEAAWNTRPSSVEALSAARAALENLASDLEEVSRLACVDKGERRTYKTFAAEVKRILAALSTVSRPTNEKEGS